MICLRNGVALLEEKEVNLTANQPYSDTYYDFIVDREYSNPASCNAYVKIIDPIEQTESQSFSIDLEEKLQPKITTCLDSGCLFETKIFTEKENGFYVKVYVEADEVIVQNPVIIGFIENDEDNPMELTFNDGITKVEGLSSGIYKIKVIASKSGYRDGLEETNVGVMTDRVNPIDLRVCNVDGVCDGNENMQNCPLDCGSNDYNVNERNLGMYSRNQVFLIPDRSWQNVLKFVPVTTWDFNNQINKYPAIIYHDEGSYLENHNYALGNHGATITSSSFVEFNPPENLIDGDITTNWNNGNSDPASYFIVEFDEPQEQISTIIITTDEPHYAVIRTRKNETTDWGSYPVFQGILDPSQPNEINFMLREVGLIKVELIDSQEQDSLFAKKTISEIEAYKIGDINRINNYASSELGGEIVGYSSEDPAYPVENLIDGDLETRWDSGEINVPWFEVDLGGITPFDRIHLYERYEPYYARIKVKANEEDPWILVDELLLDKDDFEANRIRINQVNARYIRVELADSEFQEIIPNNKGASEIEVYNSLGGQTLYPSFDADSAIHFLQLYGAEKVVVVDDAPADLMNLLFLDQPLGAGLNGDQVELISSDDVFSFWTEFGMIVVADPDDYEGALMGSVIASYLNIPFVLIGEEDLGEYEEIIDNRWVYGVAPLDASVMEYIENNAENSFIFPIEVFQQYYLEYTDADKVLMLNPNDIGEVYRSPYGFYPDRSSYKIFDLFGKASLAAPFLAAGKHELMLFNDVGISPLNEDCNPNQEITDNVAFTNDFLKNEIDSFFSEEKPEFLTIVASPKAIPDSVYSYCLSGYGQVRYQKDYEYAKDPSDFDDLKKPDLVVDNNDDMHIVWIENGNKIMYSKYGGDGTLLIDDVVVFPEGSGAVDNPKIDVDNENNAHIAWESNSGVMHKEIFYAKIVDGEVITNDVIYEDNYDSDQPDIKVDNDGNVNIVYRDMTYTYNDPKIFYVKLDNNGNILTYPFQISADGNSRAGFPRIDVDDEGYSHIIYSELIYPEDVRDQVYYAKYHDYNVLTNIRVSEGVADTYNPDLAIDSNGDVHVVWIESREEGRGIYYSKLDNDGNIIVGSNEVEEVEGIINPRVFADQQVHVIWKDMDNGLDAILYQKYNKNGNPIGFDKVIVRDGAEITFPIFDQDSNDNFFVAYQSKILDDFIYYKKVDKSIRELIPDTLITKKYNYYMNPGRIYGISTTDVSSYIARALNYDKIMDKLYGDEYTGTSTARPLTPGYESSQEFEALEMRDRTMASGYDSTCSIEAELGCDHTGRWDIPESFFEHKQFFTFADHGWINALDGVITSSTLPLLDLTWMNVPSCSPANFWGGLDREPGVHTFGHTALRKGAIGLHGATGVSWSSSLRTAPFSVRLLTQDERISIGEIGTYLTKNERYDEEFIALGDPTIILRAKKVMWDDPEGPIIVRQVRAEG